MTADKKLNFPGIKTLSWCLGEAYGISNCILFKFIYCKIYIKNVKKNFNIQLKIIYMLALRILLIGHYRSNYKIYQTKTGPDWLQLSDQWLYCKCIFSAITTDTFTDNSISAHEILLTHSIEDKTVNDDFLVGQDFYLQAKLIFDRRLRDLS